MTYEQLLEALMDYFADKSRSAGDTKSDLIVIAEQAHMLADTIEEDQEYE